MLRTSRYVELVAEARRFSFASDSDKSGARDDAPEFVAVRVRLQAQFLSGVYGNNLDRRRLIERELLKRPPRARFSDVRASFHHIFSIIIRHSSACGH